MDDLQKGSGAVAVPLLPAGDLGFRWSPVVPTVGSLTVQLDPELPGALRFENDVELRTCAAIDVAVMTALSSLAGARASTVGLKVKIGSNEIDSALADLRDIEIESERDRIACIDLKLLEIPILIGALRALGIETVAPEGALCWGKIDGSLWSTDDQTRSVSHGDSATASYLAKINGLEAFCPDSVGAVAGKGSDRTKDDIQSVLETESSPDFIRAMCRTGLILEGVPVPYRAKVLAKARKVFDGDVALWDESITPVFEKLGLGFLTIVAGDFYGNPRLAEVERGARGDGSWALPGAGGEGDGTE